MKGIQKSKLSRVGNLTFFSNAQLSIPKNKNNSTADGCKSNALKDQISLEVFLKISARAKNAKNYYSPRKICLTSYVSLHRHRHKSWRCSTSRSFDLIKAICIPSRRLIKRETDVQTIASFCPVEFLMAFLKFLGLLSLRQDDKL